MLETKIVSLLANDLVFSANPALKNKPEDFGEDYGDEEELDEYGEGLDKANEFGLEEDDDEEVDESKEEEKLLVDSLLEKHNLNQPHDPLIK